LINLASVSFSACHGVRSVVLEETPILYEDNRNNELLHLFFSYTNTFVELIV